MTVIQAIKIINRRSKTLLKLFGANSDIYELFSTTLAEFDFNEKGGLFTLKNNALNRANYRQLTAWAKRIQKMPYQVLKRKADKLKKEINDDKAYFDDTGDGEIIDLQTYYKWLSTFNDYFESCYALAVEEGLHSRDAYERAEELYNDRSEYVSEWNAFYTYGSFDEFKQNYETDFYKQLYDIDEETGEMTPKHDFARGL